MNNSILKKALALDKKILEAVSQKIKLIHSIPEKETDTILKLKNVQPGIDQNNFDATLVRDVFSEIYDNACSNKRVSVAYLGPEATNSHLAATEIFGEYGSYIAQTSITDIFKTVEDQKALFGVVPIENSVEGTINLTLDLLNETDLKIYGEKTISICNNLIGKGKISDIKEIYSHPQPLGQCRKWLRTNCPTATQIETSSTTAAVQKVGNNKKRAAIGTLLAAKIYGCPVIEKNIQDSRSNKTRFFIISYHKRKPGHKNKTSIVFLCQDKPGALVEALKIFKKFNINLTKIESRPSKRQDWEYYFYVDLLGYESDEIVSKALQQLKGCTIYSKVLGSYPAG